MILREIEIPVTNIAGVGKALAKVFSSINIFTVSDLLTYYPRDWEDRTKTHPISEYSLHAKVHTLAKVLSHEWFGFGRMKTLKIIIQDLTGIASLICFNRPFLEKSLPVGAIISVTGAFSLRRNEVQCSSFDAICVSNSGDLTDYEGKILSDSVVLPIYPLTQGLSQNNVRKAITKALSEYSLGIDNELPENIIQKYGLMNKAEAIHSIHIPKNIDNALQAKKTLVFEELYFFQQKILSRVQDRKKNRTFVTMPIELADTEGKNFYNTFVNFLSPLQKQLLQRLPFQLTDDQIKTIIEINCDIDANYGIQENESPFQMARLLQGDVGSGKTLVAFFTCLRVLDWGSQCAIMAPTEILAKQHAQSASLLLEPLISSEGKGISIAFLTGNIQSKGRQSLLKALKNNEIDIIIGTHALFSSDVIYNNLRLVVVDEQHRFGVVQRNAILDKGRNSIALKNSTLPISPSLLMMSATPIPQTLALTIYGDLDVSTISTMPKGRKPIKTLLVRQGNENKAYESVRLELKKGRQAYFVYPRIEDEQILDTEEENTTEYSENLFAEKEQKTYLKSAEQTYDFLSKQVYPEYTCAVIHSKIDEQEQSRILSDFRDNKIQILVATSVVEVGVDVPNATCMVIEHAERFGLAALHQLRGRVGRGSEQSSCFLIYSTKLTGLAKSRLNVLHESIDGFLISEEDLRLRGPGEVTGIQQSGYLTLGIADPVRDRAILELVRKELLAQMGSMQ